MIVIYYHESGEELGVDQTAELPTTGEQVVIEDRIEDVVKSYIIERVTRKVIKISQSSMIEVWIVELDDKD